MVCVESIIFHWERFVTFGTLHSSPFVGGFGQGEVGEFNGVESMWFCVRFNASFQEFVIKEFSNYDWSILV